MQNGERLRQNIEKQARRMTQAEKERPTLLAQTVFLGTLALLFVLPVVGGAYLGHWIDSLQAGYSYRWTVSLLMTGLIVGGHERLSLHPEALKPDGQAGTSRTARLSLGAAPHRRHGADHLAADGRAGGAGLVRHAAS